MQVVDRLGQILGGPEQLRAYCTKTLRHEFELVRVLAARYSLKRAMEVFPPEYRDLAPLWVWWLLYLIAFLAVILILGLVFKRIGKSFARKPKVRDWDKGWRENLEECPMPIQPPNERALAVYHVPVRMRLVVVAVAIQNHQARAHLFEPAPELRGRRRFQLLRLVRCKHPGPAMKQPAVGGCHPTLLFAGHRMAS